MIKVICIKDCSFGKVFCFKNGESYDAEFYADNVIPAVKVFHHKLSMWGFCFYLEKKVGSWLKFSDFFMKLAEWREKQIKSVLDE